MIASLPMYERRETAAALQSFWTTMRKALADKGVNAPAELTPGGCGSDFWASKDLVFSQTCGLPYRLGLHSQVSLIGTPDMQLDGCEPGYYRSAIVVNRKDKRNSLDEFSSATLAINNFDSQSGYAAFYEHWNHDQSVFPNIVKSGSHVTSAQWVANGLADIAAIDAATWRQIENFDSFSSELTVLEWTKPTPTLPFITSQSQNTQIIFDAATQAIECLTNVDATNLGMHGLVHIPSEKYLEIDIPPLAALE